MPFSVFSLSPFNPTAHNPPHPRLLLALSCRPHSTQLHPSALHYCCFPLLLFFSPSPSLSPFRVSARVFHSLLKFSRPLLFSRFSRQNSHLSVSRPPASTPSGGYF